MSKYAYVFTLMKDDKYLTEILVSAYSLFQTKTKYDVVCMVTPDISEDVKAKMKYIGIRVVNVEYIIIDIYVGPLMFTSKELYSSKRASTHGDNLSTVWNSLNLTEYKKVFVLSNNIIIQRNIDHVFNLPAPATRIIAETISDMKNGEKLSDEIAKKFIYKKGGTIYGGCVLLKPNEKRFNNLLKYIKKIDLRSIRHDMNVYEIILFSFFVKKKKGWHYLDNTWACVRQKYGDRCSLDDINIINYTGGKISWNKKMSTHTDLKKWYYFYEDMKRKYPMVLR